MRALLCTHHPHEWSGSETVVIELAEALAQRGFDIDLYAPFQDEEFCADQLPSHASLLADPDAVRLDGYDLVYVQHQTLSRILGQQPDAAIFSLERPFFQYGHLSSVEPFELPGPFVEADIADALWLQSPRTLEEYLRRYDPELIARARVFPNPAPQSFDAVPATENIMLRRLVSVSNHIPAELLAAFEILTEQGVEVIRYGRPNNNKRLPPEALRDADAVVSIGKTAQYALRARRPLFCYDHFGGPGWIDADNFAETSRRSFSGLNAAGQQEPEDLARAIVDGFPPAARFAASIPNELMQPYRLEEHVDALVAAVRNHKANPSPLFAERRGTADHAVLRARWSHEASLYALIDRQYQSRMKAQLALKKHKQTATETQSRLRDQNARLKQQIEILKKRTAP